MGSDAMNAGDGARPSGPFTGVLVIDLTRVLAGPFCTMLLADMGARVIKVEQPVTGDDSRGYGPFLDGESVYFKFVNRGKESIALNLKNTADLAVLEGMIKRADVLVENYRPGTMDKLGLTAEAVAKLNPRLIYASCSGFGQTGPMSHLPAYDTVVQALSGLMSITGYPDGPPTRAGISVADLTSGLYTFSAIVSALYAREKTGHGARVDIAMLDGMLSYMLHGAMEYIAYGRTLGRLGNGHSSITPFDTYQAADESIVICVGGDEVFVRLCRAIGRADLATDPRFARNRDRHTHQHALRAEIEAVLAHGTAARWVAAIAREGVPCAKIQTVPEALESPQAAARNMIVEAGGLRMMGNPIKISGFDDPLTRRPAPALDSDGAAIRREFGPAFAAAAESR
jgi:CoA:oxalate CoA-transferase